MEGGKINLKESQVTATNTKTKLILYISLILIGFGSIISILSALGGQAYHMAGCGGSGTIRVPTASKPNTANNSPTEVNISFEVVIPSGVPQPQSITVKRRPGTSTPDPINKLEFQKDPDTIALETINWSNCTSTSTNTSFTCNVTNKTPLTHHYFFKDESVAPFPDIGYEYSVMVWNNNFTHSDVTLVTKYDTQDVNGWAAGNAGTILHYDGTSWNLFPTPTTKSFRELFIVSPNDVWVVGDAGTILHFNGISWNEVPSNTNSFLIGIHMVTSNEGWAVGTGGKIIHYDGNIWNEVPSPTTQHLHDVFMVTNSSGTAISGWAVGNNGTILHYDGNSWNIDNSPTQSGLVDVEMLIHDWGWATGLEGTILNHSAEWTIESTPTTNPIYYVDGLSFANAWAVGSLGTILHFDGTWNLVPSPTEDELLDVHIISPDDIWAVGSSGTMLHYDGTIWATTTSPTTSLLEAVDILTN